MVIESMAAGGAYRHRFTIKLRNYGTICLFITEPDTTKLGLQQRECQLNWVEVRRICGKKLQLHAPMHNQINNNTAPQHD